MKLVAGPVWERWQGPCEVGDAWYGLCEGEAGWEVGGKGGKDGLVKVLMAGRIGGPREEELGVSWCGC